MPNYLKMPKKSQVLALLELGWSYRRIEAETGVRRETVSRYDLTRRSNAAKRFPDSDASPPSQSPRSSAWRRPKFGQNVRRIGASSPGTTNGARVSVFQGKRCFGFGRDNVLEAAPSVTITDAVPVFETTNLESCRGVLRIAHWLWGGLTVYAGAVALHHGDKDWFITG